MGRPLYWVCAKRNCDAVSLDANNEGVFFDLQEAILLKKMKNTQLWACCSEHKEATLNYVLSEVQNPKDPDALLDD